MDQEISTLIQNLNRNNIAGTFVNNREELLVLLKKLIPVGSTIGCGDSVTLEETGIFQWLRNSDYRFYDKFVPGLSKEQKRKIYLDNFSADFFISGANAVTMNGEIFNIDGNGSRVAPMLYGPNQVIIVIGINKITSDVDSAIKRTRQIAAPMDAKRLRKNTPCTSLMRCIDCKHKERICNDFVLITGQFIKDRIRVIIVNEKLGY
ncbi:lactate utilization protein [Clostridium sp. BNL1100]|uniref:lactate utilization protein n=1 Tax=Clostridium sp. BNL1100 TaxID=755731 RepID=UPI00024A7AD9|nr:lactate utilization protein [Clostridium sp. BNL1100]AEY67457.1 outer membrane protein/protective antigen OMA87 [Clostridium sp. BNL1100]